MTFFNFILGFILSFYYILLFCKIYNIKAISFQYLTKYLFNKFSIIFFILRFTKQIFMFIKSENNKTLIISLTILNILKF